MLMLQEQKSGVIVSRVRARITSFVENTTMCDVLMMVSYGVWHVHSRLCAVLMDRLLLSDSTNMIYVSLEE